MQTLRGVTGLPAGGEAVSAGLGLLLLPGVGCAGETRDGRGSGLRSCGVSSPWSRGLTGRDARMSAAWEEKNRQLVRLGKRLTTDITDEVSVAFL